MIAEGMIASINNCIPAPFATGGSIQMTMSNGTWQGIGYAAAMQSLSEIDNEMSFLTKKLDCGTK